MLTLETLNFLPRTQGQPESPVLSLLRAGSGLDRPHPIVNRVEKGTYRGCIGSLIWLWEFKECFLEEVVSTLSFEGLLGIGQVDEMGKSGQGMAG